MRMSILSLSIALASAGVWLSLAPQAAAADVELPRAVPAAKLTQQVGLTEIAVEYECLAATGPKIWGGVIPYDKLWLVGSNLATKIRFSRDVMLGDRSVPAGSYWMLAIPAKGTWTIVFNKSADLLVRTADYKPDLDVARLKVAPKSAAGRRDRLLFTFSEISEERASLDLEWDTLRVPITIQVNTRQQVLSSINSLDGTWRSFANAARYMLETKKDYTAGLKYIDEALALKEDWYAMWVKGALFAAKGDFAAASDWAARAYALEQKVGNGSYLEPDLTKMLAEWSRKAHRPETAARSATPSVSKEPPTVPPPFKEDTPTKEAASEPAVKAVADEAPARAPLDVPPPALRRARLRGR